MEESVPLKVSKDDLADKLLFLNIETQGLLDLRVQNMAISIDKINLFFRKNLASDQTSKADKGSKKADLSKNSVKPQNGILNFVRESPKPEESPERPQLETSPFYMISSEDDEEFYWGKLPESLRLIMSKLLIASESKATDPKDKSLAKDLIEFLETKLPNLQTELAKRLARDFKIGSDRLAKLLPVSTPRKMVIRRAFIYISVKLRAMGLFEFHPAISDLLVLQAFASLLFKNRSFNSYEQVVDIRECDLTVFQKYFENSQLKVDDEARIVNRQVK